MHLSSTEIGVRVLLFLLGLTSLLTACGSLSSHINSGDYSYAAKDVSINHFGVNYSISIPLQVRDQRVTAQTLASDCESGTGSLKILTGEADADLAYPVKTNSNTAPDTLFKFLCDKNPKLVRVVRGCS